MKSLNRDEIVETLVVAVNVITAISLLYGVTTKGIKIENKPLFSVSTLKFFVDFKLDSLEKQIPNIRELLDHVYGAHGVTITEFLSWS